jgi:anti-sigma factor RsiW
MNCDETKAMLGGYADGELTPIETDAVASHLETCGRCRQIVRDQQRVQHVLGAYRPPAVPDLRWHEIGKRLRAELAGTGEPIVLKTRARTESLDPTPPPQAAVGREERPAAARPARNVPAPSPRVRAPRPTSTPPAVTVMQVHAPKGRHAPFAWVAHVVGATAAALVILFGLAAVWQDQALPLGPQTLARQDDVSIMEMQMTDPDYSVVVFAGDATDGAAVWVVPSEDQASG